MQLNKIILPPSLPLSYYSLSRDICVSLYPVPTVSQSGLLQCAGTTFPLALTGAATLH